MTEAAQEQRRRLFLAEVSRVVPGLYGWLATVLTPVLQRGAGAHLTAARGFALLALASLAGSFVQSSRHPKLARWLGVYAFIACCFGAWACLGTALRSDQLDPVRGAMGAVGFLLHALAWGAPPRDPEEALDNLVAGTPLQPRNQPGRLGAVVLALGLGVGLVPTAVAFGVERPSSSLLAHAAGLGAGLLLIGASTDLALRVGKAQQFSTWRVRATRALWPLGSLVVALGIGLLWLALR